MKKSIFVLFFALFSISTFVAQNNYIDVFDGPKIFILEGLNKDLFLHKGAGKKAIPVSLPKDAKGFYYRVSILPKKQKIKDTVNLLHTIQQMPDHYSNNQIADLIHPEPSTRHASLYLLKGVENASGMEAYNYFEYHKKFICRRSFYGYMENNQLEEFYLAIANNHDWKSLKIVLEVIAVM